MSQKNEDILLAVQDGIIKYVEEVCMLFPDLETAELTPKLVDTFFGLLYESQVCCVEKITQSLGVNDNY